MMFFITIVKSRIQANVRQMGLGWLRVRGLVLSRCGTPVEIPQPFSHYIEQTVHTEPA